MTSPTVIPKSQLCQMMDEVTFQIKFRNISSVSYVASDVIKFAHKIRSVASHTEEVAIN